MSDPGRLVASRHVVDELVRANGPRVLGALVRSLGDFDLAEDALQEALAAALVRWPIVGVPPNPRSACNG